jgi:hypothetical protein
MFGWPKRGKLARACLWEYSYEELKLARLLGQLGVFSPEPVHAGERPAGREIGLRPSDGRAPGIFQ